MHHHDKTETRSSLIERLDPDTAEYARNCLDHIWKNIELGNIDLSYAVVGHDLHTGKPMYEYDLIMTLLSTYGYTSGISTLFVDEFMLTESPDGGLNVVVTSEKKARIFRDIHGLQDNPCAGAESK